MSDAFVKSALVTGGSGGIGQAVTKRLAGDGFAVAVHYSGKADNARRVVDEINGRGGRAVAVQADVTDAAQVRASVPGEHQGLRPARCGGEHRRRHRQGVSDLRALHRSQSGLGRFGAGSLAGRLSSVSGRQITPIATDLNNETDLAKVA